MNRKLLNKKTIRETAIAQLKEMPSEEFERQCQSLANQLFSTEEWKKTTTIGITIANAHEIYTIPIIEQALEEGKRVAVPRCIPSEKRMDFRYIEHLNQLEKAYYDLLEPIVNETKAASPEEIDYMVVPGVAFDERGYRIGYGGGYYDRYLQDYKGATVSLLFSNQLLKQLPVDEYDVPVDSLILPNGMKRNDIS